jgi:hypothetical protein
MEEWENTVRNLKDQSQIRYKTEEVAVKIYQDLKRFKIRDKGKFKQRMGPEFESWVFSLSNRFSDEVVKEIISDDDFWTATLKITIGI